MSGAAAGERGKILDIAGVAAGRGGEAASEWVIGELHPTRLQH